MMNLDDLLKKFLDEQRDRGEYSFHPDFGWAYIDVSFIPNASFEEFVKMESAKK